MSFHLRYRLRRTHCATVLVLAMPAAMACKAKPVSTNMPGPACDTQKVVVRTCVNMGISSSLASEIKT